MSRESTVGTDRFSEMNAVLSECVKEVEAKVAGYVANQRRIEKDGSKAGFAALGDAQVAAMAAEALSARQSAIREAAVASIVGQIKADARA